MPKFQFKNIASKVTSGGGRKASQDELHPLNPSQSKNSLYTQGRNNSTRSSSTSSSSSSLRKNSNSTSNPTLDQIPTVRIRPGMPSPTAGSPPPIPPATMDVDFDAVPFKFYARIGEQWNSGFLKAFVLLFLCLLCPFFVILIVLLSTYSTCCHSSEQRAKPQREKKKMRQALGAICCLTFVKDMVLVTVVLHIYFQTTASLYMVAHSPVLFCWVLTMFIFPALWFYLAGVRYEFGFSIDKKDLSKSFGVLFKSPKTKVQQTQKLTKLDERYHENYELLADIHSSTDEFTFIYKSAPKYSIILIIVLVVATTLVRAMIPCLLQITDRKIVGEETVEGTTDFFIVVAFATFNSLVIGLLSAPYFIYVILWQMSMLREWRQP